MANSEARTGRRPDEWIALAAVLALAFWLRLTLFDVSELGTDGYLSVGLASLPVRDALDFSIRDFHPPLFYLALNVWLRSVGANVVAARLPVVACGVLAVALGDTLARQLWGRWAGILASALLALSPPQVSMSATVRDFEFGLLLSLASVLLFVTALDESGRGRPEGRLVALFVATVLALYTWYFHLVLLAAQVIVLLLLRGRKWGGALGVLVGAFVVYLPWVVFAVPDLYRKSGLFDAVVEGSRKPITIRAIENSLGLNLVGELPCSLGAEPARAAVAVLAVLLASLGIVLGWRASRAGRRTLVLAAASLALGIGLNCYLTYAWVGPDVPPRYLLMLTPFLVLGQVALTTAGPRSVRRPVTLVVLALLVPATIGYLRLRSLSPIPWFQDESLATIVQEARPGDGILFNDVARLGLARVFPRQALPARLVYFAGGRSLWDDVPRRSEAVVGEMKGWAKRVWFDNVSPDSRHESAVVDSVLAAEYYPADQRWTAGDSTRGQVLLKLYVGGPTPPVRPLGLRLGDQVQLVGASVAVDDANTAVLVALEWEALRPPAADYTVFVHLDDASGKAVAQHDSWPAGGLRPTSQWQPGERIADRHALVLTERAPDGDYRIRAGLYHGDSRLALPDGGNQIDVGVVRRESSGRLVVLPSG